MSESRSRRSERQPRQQYVSALIAEERRLVLVPVDPEKPWDAFKRMRSLMQATRKPAAMDLLQAPEPRRVIHLEPRRAAQA